jgi:hypothetical protein
MAAWDHHSDTGRPRRRRPALLALAAAAFLAAALTGCTFGREPQARSVPAPVIAPSAQAATGDIPQVVRKVEPSVVTMPTTRGPVAG